MGAEVLGSSGKTHVIENGAEYGETQGVDPQKAFSLEGIRDGFVITTRTGKETVLFPDTYTAPTGSFIRATKG